MAAESPTNQYAIPKKKGLSKWVKIGVPVAVVVLAGIGIGAYFGLRNKSNNASTNGNQQGSGNGNGNGNNGGTSINLEDSRLAISTDTWMQPVYPSTVSYSPRFNWFGANEQPAGRPTPQSLHSPHSMSRARINGLKTTLFKPPLH